MLSLFKLKTTLLHSSSLRCPPGSWSPVVLHLRPTPTIILSSSPFVCLLLAPICPIILYLSSLSPIISKKKTSQGATRYFIKKSCTLHCMNEKKRNQIELSWTKPMWNIYTYIHTYIRLTFISTDLIQAKGRCCWFHFDYRKTGLSSMYSWVCPWYLRPPIWVKTFPSHKIHPFPIVFVRKISCPSLSYVRREERKEDGRHSEFVR